MSKRISEEFVLQNADKVKKLAEIGCSDRDISFILDISPSSVNNKFRHELDKGRTNLRASLRKAQCELAIKSHNPTMLIWLGKNLLDQKEPKHTLEHSGKVSIEKVMFGPGDKKDQDS